MEGFTIYNQIAVVNRSTIISDIDGSNMVAALNILLVIFCNDWYIKPFTAVYVPNAATALPTNVYYIYLMDTSDEQGALGYHTLSSNIPYGKVFAKTVLSAGGVIMYENTLKLQTVAQCLSHEAFELIIDPRCNIWWMNYKTGILVAAEVSDPVQGNIVLVTLPNGVNVGMSDWILPSWQDADNTIGPFNHLNTLNAPYQIKNGYAMIIKDSKVSPVYSETDNRYETSERAASRIMKFNLKS